MTEEKTPILSEQTLAEMEAGRKAAAANAAAFVLAEKARAAENPPVENDEAAQAAAEAKPLGAVPAAEREPVFPVAGRKVKER